MKYVVDCLDLLEEMREEDPEAEYDDSDAVEEAESPEIGLGEAENLIQHALRKDASKIKIIKTKFNGWNDTEAEWTATVEGPAVLLEKLKESEWFHNRIA